MSDARNQTADWSDAGAFRAAFLSVFDPEDRAALRQAGKILALSAIAAGDHQEAVVLGEFRAALEDARMLRDYLQQIAEEGSGELDSEAAELLAREAWHWYREASDLAHGMAASLQDATGEWPEESGAERGTETEAET